MTRPGPITELLAAGVSIWLDDLSRSSLVDGRLQRLIDGFGVTGVTSNPTILHRAITGAPRLYEADLRSAGAAPPADVLRGLVAADVRAAALQLRPTFDRTGGRDGWVSVEVDPRLAGNADETVADARTLWAAVDLTNVMIKIPATTASLPAISRCLADGIPVNVTLIFGTPRYRDVLEAWLDGLERAHAAGRPITQLASVASFFVSRIDTAVDGRLAGRPPASGPDLRGRAALAVAQLAHREYERAMRSDRWRRLARLGAQPQRLLWASTSTKNPDYEDIRYVTELVAPDTVNTMSPATLAAFADHGHLPASDVQSRYAEAERLLSALGAAGIDLRQVAAELEDDGVAAFISSWAALLDVVAARQAELRAPVAG